MIHGFLDESRRGPTYMIAVVVVPARELHIKRSSMRQLVKPGQRRVHFHSEGDRRKREVLARITELDLRCRIWHCRESKDAIARAICLSEMVPAVIDLGVHRLVLESCQHQDGKDRRTLAEAVRKAGGSLGYEHRIPSEEPLLWASDALAWCYGAGGEWRRRANTLLDAVVDLEKV